MKCGNDTLSIEIFEFQYAKFLLDGLCMDKASVRKEGSNHAFLDFFDLIGVWGGSPHLKAVSDMAVEERVEKLYF